MKYERLTGKSEYGYNSLDACLNCDLEMDCGLCPYWAKALDRLAELEDKIEQGTLIELPCKVGDTVYVIYQYDDFMGTTEEPFIEKDTVSFFVYDDNKMKIVPSNYAERSDYWYTTIDILLTREEAEKRLREIQGDKK